MYLPICMQICTHARASTRILWRKTILRIPLHFFTARRFTGKEVKTQLRFMAKGKAGDNAGLVVEMLQSSSDAFMEAMADMFNDILSTATTPAAWKHSRVKVLFKKGDAKMPENYRPITLLPILYKLFSRLILSRVRETLDGAQASDQAGFRKGYSCDDHLLTVVLLTERMAEFRQPLWICAIDFVKAFDSVSHASLWEALSNQGVLPVYIESSLQGPNCSCSGRRTKQNVPDQTGD